MLKITQLYFFLVVSGKNKGGNNKIEWFCVKIIYYVCGWLVCVCGRR